MINHCKDCKHCRDRGTITEIGYSNDCFYMDVCDPLGGKDYWEERMNEK